MEQHKKNFKIVTSKRTRVILPNIFTLVGVCIGLSSIKFAFDGRFEISILAIIMDSMGLATRFLRHENSCHHATDLPALVSLFGNDRSR